MQRAVSSRRERVRDYSRWKCSFNALHIKRRPSNNSILSILDRRHSRLQMRMNWRNFERWVYLCLVVLLSVLLHIHPRRASPRSNILSSDIWTYPFISFRMRCQRNTAYLESWKGTTLLVSKWFKIVVR